MREEEEEGREKADWGGGSRVLLSLLSCSLTFM